jgi:ATP/ADP translocase
MGNIILSAFQFVCRWNFGDFEAKELKKFLRMGLIFTLMVGVYWTLRSLKDAVFIQLVDKLYLPYAKTVSVLALVPLVGLYTKFLERFSRNKMLVLMPAFYGIMVLGFSVCMWFAQAPQQVIAARALVPYVATQVLGYVFYVFVDVRFKAQAWIETFGSRASKEAGSLFNMVLAPLQASFGPALGRSYYLLLSGCFGFPLLALWFVAACFLGTAFRKAVREKCVVC